MEPGEPTKKRVRRARSGELNPNVLIIAGAVMVAAGAFLLVVKRPQPVIQWLNQP